MCPAEPMDAEQLLFLLYTSGTTGKPKGIMHTTGGYLTQVAFTHKYVFDLHPDDRRVLVHRRRRLGHRPQLHRLRAAGQRRRRSVMYEGVPNFPGNDRLWAIVEKYEVTIFYTAPTAIRTFMKWGAQEPAKHDLSSLRVLGSVGEPINPEAWMWYHEHIGGGRCPIVDTWWQTETGGIMISPLPGATTTKPGSATFPLPGIGAEVVDDAGKRVEHGGGYLTLTRPWPGMLRGIWGDPQRYRETYWSRFAGRYFAGDGAKLDDDGYLWLLGRVDDVMNVSGHRISTTEVESALVVAPGGRRGGGRRRQRRHHRPGDHRLRHAARRSRGRHRRAARPRRHRDRRHRQAEDDLLHPRPAQDPQRQDHAPPAARRRRGPQPRRHHHARRRIDRRRAPTPSRRSRHRGLVTTQPTRPFWVKPSPGPADTGKVTDEELAGEPGALATRPEDDTDPAAVDPVFTPKDFRLNLGARLTGAADEPPTAVAPPVVADEEPLPVVAARLGIAGNDPLTNLDSPAIRKLTWEHVVPDRPVSSAPSAATLVPLPPPGRVPPPPPQPVSSFQPPAPAVEPEPAVDECR